MTLTKTIKVLGCATAVIFVLSLVGCQTATTQQVRSQPADGSTLAAGDALGSRCYPSINTNGSTRVTAVGTVSSVDMNW